MNKLTVVIAFLNEGDEVENTLNEVRRTAHDAVDIILVDDASDDGRDYESVAKKYNAAYIKKSVRSGSGPAKQTGIDACQTPYFLLLDAHMRLNDDNWWIKITQAVDDNPRALYCCRTQGWDYETKKIRENSEPMYAGFMINYLSKEPKYSIMRIISLSAKYGKQIYKNSDIIEVPCVWCANYAAEKKYWNYLRGYEGLKLYGLEEQYVSIKAWMEGGKCLMINNAVIGHMFKKSFTYKEKMITPEVPYNKIFVANVLQLPKDFQKQITTQIKESSNHVYNWVLSELYKTADQAEELKAYYKKIFTKDYSAFGNINQHIIDSANAIKKEEEKKKEKENEKND